MLYLDQTNLATNEDIENELVHWAKMFKATTWEEIKTIVDGNPTFEEVANRMYSANIIPEEQTYLEAHERFLAQKRGAYAAGEEKAREESRAIIAEKDALIAEKDKEIAELKAQLAAVKQNQE